MKQVNYRFLFVFSVAFAMLLLVAQRVVLAQPDSTVREGRRIVTLKPVVVRNNLNVAAFIERVKNDSSFFKAFRNLRVIGYTSLNDIQVFDRNDKVRASLHSKTIQYREGSCRWMKVVEEKTSGDFYDDEGDFNYYTAQLYGSLFLSRDTICGENNIVKGIEFNPRGKSRMDKHKEQLKMLFFNPGKKIPGLPFIGNKIALFDDDVSALYDFEIDMAEFKNEMCYVFKIKPRADLDEGQKSDIVLNEMTTWFRTDTWEIVARNYDLSYQTGVYDFDVHMEVEMTQFEGLLIPAMLRYNGSWDIMFKKRENAVFTATIFDLKRDRIR